ncbi:alpha-hydroxy-acid oxidizing enzyme [Ahniella affigens]|uniref:Alpha-hydroxy-acid oxidizing enzyme n=1 Tax=Ahniella affigens TaxID=2021234 RepID=A0A2P1PYY5_9GAMM|nr:alpha-hydroxy-acid oxidizing enzyme [Ahniella affigens]
MLPPDLLSAADYERHANVRLPPAVWAWLEGGSGDEASLIANRRAFESWSIVPRVLRRSGQGSTRVRLLGQQLAMPILLAPIGQMARFHVDGEVAVARAAAAAGTQLIASSNSSLPISDIANQVGNSSWFQLYWQGNRERTLALLHRAEAAGCTAIVLTLDTPIQPASPRAQVAGASALPFACPNLRDLPALPPRSLQPGDSVIFQGAMADAPDAEDVAWLRARTKRPLLAKGVMHPDDAALLIALGCDGLVVSNHGGRALPSAPASLTVLPAIRRQVGPAALVLMDGGVRTGCDVFKALALGANAVLLGRPQAHALAVAGALGVAHLLRLLHDELSTCMALAGRFRVSDIVCDDLLANP